MLQEMMQLVQEGGQLDYDQALALATESDPSELYWAADRIRHHFHGDSLDLCSIVNAKSGKCTEDCRFCAQSSHYDVQIDEYDELDIDFALALAEQNNNVGVRRLSLVTAGRTVSMTQIEKFGEVYRLLAEKTDMSFCASMGMLSIEKAKALKKYGVSRYHCNLEASKSFFPRVCQTHTWEEKVASIKAAQEGGLEVCSGGIIGMGESLEHRLELAFELRELGIRSIPVNILTPIPNTPFADLEPLRLEEVLTCIAMFRFINPRAVIRLAGGRGNLDDDQSRFFTAGANGAIVGDYLTTTGSGLQDDLLMFERLGFDMSRYRMKR